MNEHKEYLKRDLNVSDEEYQQMVQAEIEREKANPNSITNANKNIVLLQKIAEDLGLMGLITLQNDNQLGELVMSLMVQNNDLAIMVMDLQSKIQTLESGTNA